MTRELERYIIQPEDVLTDREYQVLQRAQTGKLACPRCPDTPLSGTFIFVKNQIKGVLLSCPKCEFREL